MRESIEVDVNHIGDGIYRAMLTVKVRDVRYDSMSTAIVFLSLDELEKLADKMKAAVARVRRVTGDGTALLEEVVIRNAGLRIEGSEA